MHRMSTMRMKRLRSYDGRKRLVYLYSAGKREGRAAVERIKIAYERKKRL
jgi:hypothetical protein